jgi:hypothetical protein
MLLKANRCRVEFLWRKRYAELDRTTGYDWTSCRELVNSSMERVMLVRNHSLEAVPHARQGGSSYRSCFDIDVRTLPICPATLDFALNLDITFILVKSKYSG